MTPTQWSYIVVLVLITVAAAVLDVRTRRIPNWFTVPVFAAGLLFHIVTAGLAGLGTAAAGFATGFGILLLLYLMGGGGGGDVKLMGALGTWLGATSTLFVFVLSAVFAVAFTVVVVIAGVWKHGYQSIKRRYRPRTEASSGRRKGKGGGRETARQRVGRRIMPYALPVAFSTWTILIWRVVSQSV
jgi:prepilin peptidase CpaA